MTISYSTYPIEHLRDLTLMRWLAIIGQLMAYGACVFFLKIELPLLCLLLLTTFLALFNATSITYFKGRSELSTAEYFLQLTVDVMTLFGLLYFSGGVHNPFATLFLLQVVIASSVLTLGLTWFLAGLVTMLYFVLYLSSSGEHTMLQHMMMEYHLPGMVLSFSLLCLLICYFVAQTHAKLRKSEQLNLENEQLVMLGAFAANTAHQLGTPLSTMSIVAETFLAGELTPFQRSQMEIMRTQIMRSSEIMRELSLKSGHELATAGGPISLENFCRDLLAVDWDVKSSAININYSYEVDARIIVADQSLKLALINIFDNALEAARSKVEITMKLVRESLVIEVNDDGEGPSTELLNQLGAPIKSAKEMGLGIGLMLSRSYFLRHHGDFKMSVNSAGGAFVQMRLPLQEVMV